MYCIVESDHWTTFINNINAWFRDMFVTETRQATVEPSLNLVIKKVVECFTTYTVRVNGVGKLLVNSKKRKR